MRGFVVRLLMRIVAGSAPEPVAAPFPTHTAAQLLRLADDLQRCIVARVADENGKSLFERLARREIVPVLSGIENPCFPLQMALFADAVPRIWREALRVHDIGARRLGHMLRA